MGFLLDTNMYTKPSTCVCTSLSLGPVQKSQSPAQILTALELELLLLGAVRSSMRLEPSGKRS